MNLENFNEDTPVSYVDEIIDFANAMDAMYPDVEAIKQAMMEALL